MTAKSTLIGGGVGYRQGQVAFAVGASHRAKDDRTTLKASVGVDSQAVSLGAGVGVEF